MKSLAASLVIALCACPTVGVTAPSTYAIVTKVSRVTFTFTHQGFIQISGSLHMAPGTFSFDHANWANSSIDVILPTRSLDMGDALWNRQIRGDEAWAPLFSNPNIEFRSTELRKSGENHGTVYGDLTIAGVTRPVMLDLTVNKLGKNAVSKRDAVGFSATAKISRAAFGLNAYSDLVGDELTVQIQLEGSVGPETEDQTDLSAKGVDDPSLPKAPAAPPSDSRN